MQKLNQDNTPWFKQFWPWFLIAIPLITIVYCMLMIYLAITTENSLVSDNYYKDGLAINRTLSMDQRAEELQLTAAISINNGNRVALTLAGNIPQLPSYLTIKLLHPTLDGRDIELKLLPEPEQRYSARLEKSLQGRWYIDVVDNNSEWRLKGESTFPRHTPLSLGSGS